MSEPILPLRQWPAGIQQASVPANDNALRLEALSRPALGVADNETTGSLDGDVWIVGGAPDGAFASFDENDIALYHVDPVSDIGGWHAWAPVEGLRLVVNDVRKVYAGTAGWIDDPSITGGSGTGVVETIVAGTGISVDSTDPANPIVSATGGGGGASTTQTEECMSGLIVTPANGDYRIVVKAPHAGTITETTTISASGTCTLTFKINTTALGGTANSVSTTEQSQAHASANAFAAGDDIVLTVSSNASCSKMTFTVKYTRTLQ